MIKEELLKLKDKKYLDFHSKLCKDVNLIGIRVPVLRNYAKKLYLENISNIDDLLLKIDNEYYEEIMLKGMIIGMDKVDANKFIRRIKEFVPLIDNWAVCDTFCAGLKLTKKYMDDIFKLICEYLKSDKEYELRFALVMFLDYFINDKYIDKVFELIKKINNKDYYCEMAIAWALSVCLINYFDKTIMFLENGNLSDFVYKKTIQKALESFRIDNLKKDYLKSLRDNNN